ncbi:hypothetical protein CR3_0662 [Cupriavidus gilardii CR3]|nr:hypothetical protein CR3_0662 [Cupriavidus gilardii CR3]
MPAEQTLTRHQCLAVGGGIKHHLDHAFDMPIDRSERADVNAQPAGDGRAHGFNVELLAFDLAGLDYVLGERRETRLVTQGHADVSQTPHQEPLGTTDLSHGLGQRRQVEAPVWPVTGLPDVFVFAAIHAEIMGCNLRSRKSIAAHCAVNLVTIRRMTDRLAPGMGVNGCVIGCGNGRGFSSRFEN